MRPCPENRFNPGFSHHLLQVVPAAVCESCPCGFQDVYLGSSGIKTFWERRLGSECHPLLVVADGRIVQGHGWRDLWVHWLLASCFSKEGHNSPRLYPLAPVTKPCYPQKVLPWLGFVICVIGGLSAGILLLKMVVVGKARSIGLERSSVGVSDDDRILQRWV